MRKARFARAVETASKQRERVSIREALWFGLRSPETTDEASLADWRVGSLDHMAILLGITHILITGTCAVLFESRGTGLSADNPLIPAFLVIGCDVAAAIALWMRKRLNLASHTVTRWLCAYLAVVGVLWTWFGIAVQDDTFLLPIAAAPIAMSAGHRHGCGRIDPVSAVDHHQHDHLGNRRDFAIREPAGSFRCRNPVAGPGRLQHRRIAEASSAPAAAGSTSTPRRARRSTSSRSSRQRPRLVLGDQRAGALSYVSRAARRRPPLRPHELLGRQFTDLLGVDTGARNMPRSARPWASTCRPACPSPTSSSAPTSDEDIRWSLSGTRASTSMAASSASAASAPTSPSSAAPTRRSTGSPNSIR